jgi:hypothetical protein
MSVRSFHSVFMASAVAGAALGCYLVSLRVASERAALEDVETQIVHTQGDIRLLQTEVGTRARLTQLERWNLRALALSAPNADQILGDKFQLARLVRPERRLDVEAPVVLAAAPAPRPLEPLAQDSDPDVGPVAQLLHEASYEAPVKAKAIAQLVMPDQAKAPPPKVAASKLPEAKADTPKPAAIKVASADKKAGDKFAAVASGAVTKPVRMAKTDPLAPLPVEHSTAKASRTNR